MSRILITGGNGMLGRALTPLLIEAGYTVRISSRSLRPQNARPDVEWAQTSLETGEGLAEAVASADIILHCATGGYNRAKQVDIDGTRRLLALARRIVSITSCISRSLAWIKFPTVTCRPNMMLNR